MTDAILQGILIGLILSIFVGPGFFVLVQTSVSQGVKAALILDAGIVASDISCIALSYFGLSQLMQRPAFGFTFTILGGLMLVGYGLYTALSKEKVGTAAIPAGLTKAHGIKLFIKGFIFNSATPSVIFFWIGTVTLAIAQFGGNTTNTIVYLSSGVLTYSAFDILKIYLASRVKHLFTGKKQQVIKKVAGIAIIIFGAILIYNVIIGK